MKRGIWILDEEDIAKLINLPEGRRVIGVREDWQRMSIQVGIEGEGLPEVAPGVEAPIVGRGIPLLDGPKSRRSADRPHHQGRAMTYSEGGRIRPVPRETVLPPATEYDLSGPRSDHPVVTLILQLAGILALVLASLIMLLMLTFAWKAAGAVDDLRTRLDTPDPTVSTGCPFGPGQCGG